MRWLRAGVLAAVLAMATGCRDTVVEPAPASPDAASTTPAGCPAGGLRIEPAPPVTALGATVLRLRVRNCGTRAVVLRGYPRIQVLQDGADALNYVVVHAGALSDPDPSVVRLRPGRTAWTGVSWRSTLESIGVDPIEGDHLRVGLPVPQTVRADVGLGTTATIQVVAWSRRPASLRRR